MITPISREDIPPYRDEPRSPMRQFAFEAAMDFMSLAKNGDVYEVTGYPGEGSEGWLRAVQSLTAALNTELYHLGRRSDVRVFRRRGRVFMEMREPRVFPERARNPWPGDLPKV